MNIAQYIDHTYLRPDCTQQEVRRLCEEARQYGFPVICIPPYYVKSAVEHLRETSAKVATVIGFPMGYSAVPAKVEEIKRAINEGADELDVVINLCAVKNGDWGFLRNEVDSLTTATHLKGKVIKLIIETAILTPEEANELCSLAADVGVDYVKTSTGFNGIGATKEVVAYLRNLLPPSVKIKASGGIRTWQEAKEMIEAGAERLGTSKSIEIISTNKP